jgi:hypothetical protein
MKKVKIRSSYRFLNSINLGREFVDENKLTPHKKYPLAVAGVDESLSGTLQAGGLIGGLGAMYVRYPSLGDGSEVEIAFDGTEITITPPNSTAMDTPSTAPSSVEPQPQGSLPMSTAPEYVLDRKTAHRVFVPPYAPGALNSWEPKGEPDVYMVFGRVAEFTPFRYCCAASQEVLNKLGLDIKPKPDAVLIENGTDRYVIAEFEVHSNEFFKHGHQADDIDVLVCWADNVEETAERKKLPQRILCLHALVQELLKTGEIEL